MNLDVIKAPYAKPINVKRTEVEHVAMNLDAIRAP
jgi:hypothetical protein